MTKPLRPITRATGKLRKTLEVMVLAGAVLAPGIAAARTATLVLEHGKVLTLWPQHPQADAIAIAGNKVLAVGSNRDIASYIGHDTAVIDLHGRLAVPGFIQARGRLLALGRTRLGLHLHNDRSWAAIVSAVADATAKAKPGQWVVARGWQQSVRPPQQAGATNALDQASANNPVILFSADGSALFANRKALALAGIDTDTPTPVHGVILRHDDGSPLGLVRGSARKPLLAALTRWRRARSAKETRKAQARAVEAAGKFALAHGITTFVTTSPLRSIGATYKPLAEKGALPIRVFVAIDAGAQSLTQRSLGKQHVRDGGRRGFLTVGAIGGLYMDSAARPGPPNGATGAVAVGKMARLAAKNQLQLFVTALGPIASHQALGIFRSVVDKDAPGTNRRWRINAAHVQASDIRRFGELGIIVATRSANACANGMYTLHQLSNGAPMSPAFPWHSLMTLGAMINNSANLLSAGTGPLAAIECAVTRENSDHNVFLPDQALSLTQALKSFTLWNAYGLFKAKDIGSLRPGNKADIAVLSQDISTVNEREISDTQVDYTIIDGKVAYQRQR